MTQKQIKSRQRSGIPTKYRRVLKQAIDKIERKEDLQIIMEVTGVARQRERMKPIRCCCCNRQMVKSEESTERTVCGYNATHMGPGMFACSECAADLDENGMFPEER